MPRLTLVAAVLLSVGFVSGCAEEKGKAGSPPAQTSSAAASTSTATEAAPAPKPETKDAEVEVKESGFSNKGGSLEGASFGLVLENTSADQDATDVDVTINALDEAGDVIGTTNETVSVVPPGETFNVGGDIDVGKAKISELDIQADVGDSSAAQYPTPKVSKVRVEEQEFGGTVIRAQVENVLDSDLSSITDCFAVLRDSNGDIIGGGKTFPLNDIKAGRKASIEFTFFNSLPADSADVSVDNEVTQ